MEYMYDMARVIEYCMQITFVIILQHKHTVEEVIVYLCMQYHNVIVYMCAVSYIMCMELNEREREYDLGGIF